MPENCEFTGILVKMRKSVILSILQLNLCHIRSHIEASADILVRHRSVIQRLLPIRLFNIGLFRVNRLSRNIYTRKRRCFSLCDFYPESLQLDTSRDTYHDIYDKHPCPFLGPSR
jgi:hypothetical protein